MGLIGAAWAAFGRGAMADIGMQCVVLDMGSGSTKVGFAGEDAPHNVFPSVLAKSRGSDEAQYVGHEVHKAFKADTKLPMRYPVERGTPKRLGRVSEVMGARAPE